MQLILATSRKAQVLLQWWIVELDAFLRNKAAGFINRRPPIVCVSSIRAVYFPQETG